MKREMNGRRISSIFTRRENKRKGFITPSLVRGGWWNGYQLIAASYAKGLCDAAVEQKLNLMAGE